MMFHSLDRRTFLMGAAAGVTSVVAARQATAASSVADQPIRLGVIGCGGRGQHVAKVFKSTPNVAIAYICDVDQKRRAETAQVLGLRDKQVVDDMRKILDDRSVDAVLIATPDHWHAPAAIRACQAGKHVYVEKPLSHNVVEGRMLIDAAKQAKVKVQHGTQCRSTQMMIDAVRMLEEGAIGPIHAARCWNVQRRGSIGHGRPSEPPAGLDYDNWVGPAPLVPYQSNRCHGDWHWWYHFGTGDMGNDGVHDIDYARWGLGVNTHPSKIAAIGGKFFFDDDQEFPDTQQVAFYYPGDKAGEQKVLSYEQRLWSSNYPYNCDSGVEFYGVNGQMFLSRRGKIQLRDSKNAVVEVQTRPEQQNDEAHVANFCDAIRSGAELNADATVGHLTSSLCHLANISTRVGRTLSFDPVQEVFVDDVEANTLLGRTYREYWATPRA
jgi:predicted dehydrogenase